MRGVGRPVAQSAARSQTGDRFSFLGHPDTRGRAIASGAVARLLADARHPQRDLQRLSSAWFNTTSCFTILGRISHAEPMVADLAAVLPRLNDVNWGIVGAAFSALGAFARVCERRVYPTLPGSVWEVTEVLRAVHHCLGSQHTAARLAASRLVSEFPGRRARGCAHVSPR